MKKLFALLLAAVMVLSMAACSKDEPESTTAATDAADTTEGTDATDPTETTAFVAPPGEGASTKTSYTVSNGELLAANSTAIATVGDRELTIGQLQMYYWMSVYGFMNDYSYYLTYFGLDPALPLDEQECPETGGSWQQYFLEMALNNWHSYQSLALLGEAANTPIEASLQEELDNLQADTAAAAEEQGFDSVDAMIQAQLGPGSTYDDYYAYLSVYYTGYSYFMEQYDAVDVSDAMLEAYFTENEATLAESGITKDSKLVDVRHILIFPEGGTTDAEGTTTYTDEEWEACRVAAQGILDEWLAGEATEDSFAELANEHSEDTGSNTNGGLYEDVVTGEMVENFENWCFDESRQIGDYGLVQTEYGYHIMYYRGSEPQWIGECRNGIIDEKMNELVTSAMETYPITVSYEDILLGHMDMSAES